jgi:hypothetical protein
MERKAQSTAGGDLWPVDGWVLDAFDRVYRQDFLMPMQFETDLPRIVKMVGSREKSTRLLLFGGGGGSRIGSQPSVRMVNRPSRFVRFTGGRSVQFSI